MSGRFAWVLVLLSLIGAWPVAGDDFASFRQGVEAFEAELWEAAEAGFREAIALRPRATGEPIGLPSGREERYLPYYYLGRTLFEVGDLAAARQALEESLAQGAIASASDHGRELGRVMSELDLLIGALAERLVQTEERMRQFRAESERLRAELSGSSTLRASDVNGSLTGVLDGVDRQLSEATSILGREPDHAALNWLDNLLATIAQDLALVASRIERIRATPTGPPGRLVGAVEAFFSGEYAEVMRLLEGAELKGTRESYQRTLFLAAAHFRQGAASGEPSAGLGEARELVLQCERLDREARPDEYYFSPAFREFFESVIGE